MTDYTLSAYSIETYTNVNDAINDLNISNLCTLDETDVTLENLTEGKMDSSFYIAMQSAKCALQVNNQLKHVSFVIMHGEVPKFECKHTEWTKIKTLESINEEENEASFKHLEKRNFEMYITCEGNGEYVVHCVNNDGTVTTSKTDLESDSDIVIDGETFDFYLRRNDIGEEIIFYLDVFNLISDSDGDSIKNHEFEYTLNLKLSTHSKINKVANKTLRERISSELERIEHHRGEAYQAPLCCGAGDEGDEVYMALHAIRKLIGIDYEAYDKEVEEAKK